MHANLITTGAVRTMAFRLAVTLPFALSLAFADTASAQKAKKLSYNEAFAKCRAEVNRTVAADQPGVRATVGGGCMRSHGYRLKKKM